MQGPNQAGFFRANKIATQPSPNPGRTGLKLPYKAKNLEGQAKFDPIFSGQ